MDFDSASWNPQTLIPQAAHAGGGYRGGAGNPKSLSGEALEDW